MGKNEIEVIEYLWKIMDDIDTISDILPNSSKSYREMVEKLVRQRWNTGITTDGNKLNLTKMKVPK